MSTIILDSLPHYLVRKSWSAQRVITSSDDNEEETETPVAVNFQEIVILIYAVICRYLDKLNIMNSFMFTSVIIIITEWELWNNTETVRCDRVNPVFLPQGSKTRCKVTQKCNATVQTIFSHCTTSCRLYSRCPEDRPETRRAVRQVTSCSI